MHILPEKTYLYFGKDAGFFVYVFSAKMCCVAAITSLYFYGARLELLRTFCLRIILARRKKGGYEMHYFKKISPLIFTVCLLLCSCGNSSPANDTEKESLKSQVEALQSQMEEIKETTEIVTSETVAEEPEKEEGYWVIRSYTDKFGEETGNKYITNKDYIN